LQSLAAFPLAASSNFGGAPKGRGTMGFIAWIVVGLIAGWLAEQIAGREHSLLTNLVVGVIGALVGGFVFGSILGFRYDEGFNLSTIAVATAGAVVFLWVWGLIRGRSAGPR
jgi:uncharacterized membrane protein YeaQ/YmgE (transglycosylase-associated protein family)